MKDCCPRIILLIILGIQVVNASGQIELGIYAGPSMLHLTGDRPGISIYKPGPGLLAGAILDVPLTKDIMLSLQPGYSLENARIQTADTIELYFKKKLERRDSIYLRLNSFVLPVLIKVLSDNHRFQFTSGLDFIYMYNISADNGEEKFNLQHEHQKFNISGRFGMGYIIPIRKSSLSLDLQYSQSLMNWSDNDPEVSYIPRIKTSGMRLQLAWKIPVSNKKQNRP